jgi:hypothetical protein
MMYLIHLPIYVLIQLMLLKYIEKGRALEANSGLVALSGILAVVCTIALAVCHGGTLKPRSYD